MWVLSSFTAVTRRSLKGFPSVFSLLWFTVMPEPGTVAKLNYHLEQGWGPCGSPDVPGQQLPSSMSIWADGVEVQERLEGPTGSAPMALGNRIINHSLKLASIKLTTVCPGLAVTHNRGL